jgi:hypothetical protein
VTRQATGTFDVKLSPHTRSPAGLEPACLWAIAREPEALGDSLMLLWEGAYLTRVTMGQHGPVQGAAKAARALIAAYTD